MVTSPVRYFNPLRRSKGGAVAVRILDIVIGVTTGIISGFGIGGGSLLVLYLTAVTGLSQYTAGGINLLYFIGCAAVALIGHVKNELVEWRIVFWCAVAGIIVAIPTSLLADNLNGDWLRRLFGLVLVYVGLKELQAGKRKDDR